MVNVKEYINSIKRFCWKLRVLKMKMLNFVNKILEVLVWFINEKEILFVLFEILFVFGWNKDCVLKDLLLCFDLLYFLVVFDKF